MEDEKNLLPDPEKKDYVITVNGGGKSREIRLSSSMFNFGIMSLIIGVFIFIGTCAYSVFSYLHYQQNLEAVSEARRAGEMQQEQLLSISKKATTLSETLQNLAQQEEELRIQAGLDKPAKPDEVPEDEPINLDDFPVPAPQSEWTPPAPVETPVTVPETQPEPRSEWIPPASPSPAAETQPAPRSAWIPPAPIENPSPTVETQPAPRSEWIPPAPIENKSEWIPPENFGQGGPVSELKIDEVSEELTMIEKRLFVRMDSLNEFQDALKMQREQLAYVAAVPVFNPEMIVIDGGVMTFDVNQFNGAPSANPNMPSIWPTNGVVSSPYGLRWGGTDFHPGIDIANDMGTPIVATADGVVEYAGWNSGGYGNMVDINHGNGIMTRYGHASQVVVSAGQYVRRGQLIAYMGSTGFSTGPHVHYEVHVNGQRVNPISYL